MTTHAKIQAAAPRNRELLAVLSATDHAAPGLEQQNRYLADIEKEQQAAVTRLAELDKQRKRELKDHEKYRDSLVRRFAYKISGKTDKFEERAAREEREYFEALQAEHKATDLQRRLDDMLAEARRVQATLQSDVERHAQAQRELDCLYSDIFDGPSPGFPEEDAQEQRRDDALRAYHSARVRAESEELAVRKLAEATRLMNGARDAMATALQASTFDMFGGGMWTDMTERNALQRADTLVTSSRMLVAQARRADAQVQDLPPVRIAQGSIVSDMLFDSIFTDMMFHQKIKQSYLEVEMCAGVLQANFDAARRRLVDRREIEQKARVLEDARAELQRVRREVLERAVR